MSSVPSFQRVDYSLRTNKSIERKLVFERMKELSSALPLSKYRYVGLGSLWFVDFVLAHRLLGIDVMWSIERAERAARAEYNKPYECIEIKAGASSEIIGSVSMTDWATPCLAWLDYDGRFDLDARGDCERILRNAAAGSVLVVTVNANRSSYRGKIPETSPPAVQTLRDVLGDAVPTDAVEQGRRDIGNEQFPGVLSKSVLNFMAATVRTSGRETGGMPDRFVPLFDIRHVDNATMSTIGGIVVSWQQLALLVEKLALDSAALFAGGASIAEVLDLAPLTIKEKLALDRLMPSAEETFEARLNESGVKIEAEQAEKYRRLYNHFPVFAETVF